MVKITLNGETRQTNVNSIEELLIEFDFGSKVATARNGEFVPVGLRSQTPVVSGDIIEVVAAMQGG